MLITTWHIVQDAATVLEKVLRHVQDGDGWPSGHGPLQKRLVGVELHREVLQHGPHHVVLDVVRLRLGVGAVADPLGVDVAELVDENAAGLLDVVEVQVAPALAAAAVDPERVLL